jgi:hypothetical protein
MGDDTYMGALREALKTFRTTATEFGYLENRMKEARDCQDDKESQYWEEVWQKYASDRLGIVLALLRTMSLFEQAGGRIPNPRWKTPAWVYEEWRTVFAGRID